MDFSYFQTLPENQSVELLDEARHLIDRVSKGGEGITRYDLSSGGAKRLYPVGHIMATFEHGDKIVSNPVERQIAHLGCSMHKMPKSRKLTHSAFNPSIARSLGYTDARITQSQLIANLAGIGREIVLHQDGSVSFTNHPSALTFWYALEQTRLENECLIVARGSHLTTALGQRVIKNDGGLPKFVNINIWSFYCCSGVDTYFIRTSPFPLEYQTWQVGKGCKFR